MTVYNYAKINLALNCLGRLKDGYHELDMLNVCINLKDKMSISIDKNGDYIEIICNNENVPKDENNIIYKVVDAFKKRYKLSFGIKIKLIKNIPTQAGLAGGSGNGAAVLKFLNNYFKTNLNKIDLARFIAPITSDGPYMIFECVARVKGKGEKIEPILCHPKQKIFVLKPKKGCNTKEIFENLNKDYIHPNISKAIQGLKDNNFSLMEKNFANSLLESASKTNTNIEKNIELLRQFGFEIVSMSGSGSTIFAISKKKEPYRKAKLYYAFENDFDIKKEYKIISKIKD